MQAMQAFRANGCGFADWRLPFAPTLAPTFGSMLVGALVAFAATLAPTFGSMFVGALVGWSQPVSAQCACKTSQTTGRPGNWNFGTATTFAERG